MEIITFSERQFEEEEKKKSRWWNVCMAFGKPISRIILFVLLLSISFFLSLARSPLLSQCDANILTSGMEMYWMRCYSFRSFFAKNFQSIWKRIQIQRMHKISGGIVMNECFCLNDIEMRWNEIYIFYVWMRFGFFSLSLSNGSASSQYDAIWAVNNDNNKRDGPHNQRRKNKTNTRQMQNGCEFFFYIHPS